MVSTINSDVPVTLGAFCGVKDQKYVKVSEIRMCAYKKEIHHQSSKSPWDYVNTQS